MTCKAIERLILEREERPLGADERGAVDRHLPACPDCRAFQAGRRALGEGLKDLPKEGLPRSLDLRTRQLCLEEMGADSEGSPVAARKAKVPLPVIAASVLFALLAAVWLTVTLADFKPGEALPWTAWVAVAFIAQNAFVLFFSPVIFRAARTAGTASIP